MAGLRSFAASDIAALAADLGDLDADMADIAEEEFQQMMQVLAEPQPGSGAVRDAGKPQALPAGPGSHGIVPEHAMLGGFTQQQQQQQQPAAAAAAAAQLAAALPGSAIIEDPFAGLEVPQPTPPNSLFNAEAQHVTVEQLFSTLPPTEEQEGGMWPRDSAPINMPAPAGRGLRAGQPSRAANTGSHGMGDMGGEHTPSRGTGWPQLGQNSSSGCSEAGPLAQSCRLPEFL